MEGDAMPPPYDSVAALDQSQANVGGNEGQRDEQFEITVSDPVKLGEYASAHISYRVSTKTSLPQYKYSQFSTIRRFNDFVFLHARLAEKHPGTIVPPLPEKSITQKLKVQGNALGIGAKSSPPEADEFIAQRRRGLSIFVMRVANHQALRYSPDLQRFLEASEEEWAGEVARATAEANSMKNRLGGTMQLFKDLSASATTLMTGKAQAEEEDEEYLKQRAYMAGLESHLSEAARQADRLLRKQDNLGGAMGSFSHAVLMLVQGEESAALGASFKTLGDKVDEVSKLTAEQAAGLRETFAAPLHEYVRMVQAVRAVMTDRAGALQAWQGLRNDVENQRVRIMRLRSTAAKPEKVDEAERQLEEISRRCQAAKEKFELIKERMEEELARFQRERAAEVGAVLRDFVVAQAQLNADVAKAWRSIVPGLDQAAQAAEEARVAQGHAQK